MSASSPLRFSNPITPASGNFKLIGTYAAPAQAAARTPTHVSMLREPNIPTLFGAPRSPLESQPATRVTASSIS